MTRRSSGPIGPAPRLRRRILPGDPLAIAVLAATAVLEVRDGRRDVTQLDPYVTPRVARQLAALVRRRRGDLATGGPPTLRRVVADGSRDDRLNVVVVLECDRRVIAVAVAIEPDGDSWHVAELGLPEDQPPPDDHHERPTWEDPPGVEPW